MSDWMTDAICIEVGPEPFFVGNGGSSQQGKRICAGCPVRSECLDHVMSLPRYGDAYVSGIWGGTTEEERRQLRKAAA